MPSPYNAVGSTDFDADADRGQRYQDNDVREQPPFLPSPSHFLTFYLPVSAFTPLPTPHTYPLVDICDELQPTTRL